MRLRLFPLCLALLALTAACGKKPNFVDPPVTAPGEVKPVFEQLQPPATAKAPSTTAQLPTNPQGTHAAAGSNAPDKGGFPHPYPKPWL